MDDLNRQFRAFLWTQQSLTRVWFCITITLAISGVSSCSRIRSATELDTPRGGQRSVEKNYQRVGQVQPAATQPRPVAPHSSRAPLPLLRKSGARTIVEAAKHQPATAFRIVSIKSPKHLGAQVFLSLTVKGRKKLGMADWVSNPRPSLVDAAGRHYPLGLSDSAFGLRSKPPYFDEVEFSWGIRRDILPTSAKELRFETWLRAGSGPHIPVSIPLGMDTQTHSG